MHSYYSLIQYCHDLGRMEMVNMGLVLFCPEKGFCKVMIANNARRAVKILAVDNINISEWHLMNSVKSLKYRLESDREITSSVENFNQFANERANSVRLYPARSIRLSWDKDGNPDDYARQTFCDLVDSALKKVQQDFTTSVGK